MDIKDNKQLIISVFVMAIGLVMILGTSYSLIRRTYSSSNTYSLTVGNIEVKFGENSDNNITLNNSYPVSDEEGLKSENEFSFSVNNTGEYTANYSLMIEETSKEKIGEVIRFSYNLNESGYSIVSTLSDNNVITQNMVLDVGKVDNYKMKFWIKEDALTSYMEKSFSAKLVLNTTQNEYKYATNVIQLLADMNKDGVVGINSDGNISNEHVREYRYTGIDVNNYVWFNCQDGYSKGDKRCEKWRVIGSFENTWENGIGSYKTLKIVRDNNVDSIVYNDDTYNGEYENTYLYHYANNTYYNSLSMQAKNMILDAKWNVGLTDSTADANTSYINENSMQIYGDVGTVSPSDYGFSFGKDNLTTSLNQLSFSNTWMNNSSIMMLNKNFYDNVNIITSSGVDSGEKNSNFYFQPAVYLKPDVSIIGGYGTLNSPYEIDIKFPMSYGTVEYINK